MGTVRHFVATNGFQDIKKQELINLASQTQIMAVLEVNFTVTQTRSEAPTERPWLHPDRVQALSEEFPRGLVLTDGYGRGALQK